MMQFQDWLENFKQNKIEVPSVSHSDQYATHSRRRFTDGSEKVWEIGITYTGRLVVRMGQLAENQGDVIWNQWVTEHNVIVPKDVR